MLKIFQVRPSSLKFVPVFLLVSRKQTIQRNVIALGIWAVCVCVCDKVYAQTTLKETVVVTANVSPVPFESLARPVRIITREQIARMPARSVSEILRYASSVDVRSRGFFGIQSDFSIRGAAFGQALVLVDGVRINNTQSGHHNSDIPVPLHDIEQIEILYGQGSSLYGADAFGGTINIITRKRSPERQLSLAAGDFGLVDGHIRLGFRGRGIDQSVAVAANRSSGFMFDRDFRTLIASSQTELANNTRIFISHLRKSFGANGFYGKSPSKEWTDQTMASLEKRFTNDSQWNTTAQLTYRTHGDHFLWDIKRPGMYENRHRTQAIHGLVKTRHAFSENTLLNLGGEIGGDWIKSNNLGNHSFARGSGFVELQQKIGTRAFVYPGIRYDGFSNFGSAWSPSLGAAAWILPTVKIRASVGHAFRIPTFIELYYRDPNHQANFELNPETGWATEAGLDWTPNESWLATLTTFWRQEKNVIDWIRQNSSEKWQTTNIRKLKTRGLELTVRKTIDSGSLIDLQYTYLNSRGEVATMMSKYVLDYVPHSISAGGHFRLPADLTLGSRLAYKRRVDRRRYWILDAKLTRPIGSTTLFVEATNILDTRYQEIRGVDMPSRWIRIGFDLESF